MKSNWVGWKKAYESVIKTQKKLVAELTVLREQLSDADEIIDYAIENKNGLLGKLLAYRKKYPAALSEEGENETLLPG